MVGVKHEPGFGARYFLSRRKTHNYVSGFEQSRSESDTTGRLLVAASPREVSGEKLDIGINGGAVSRRCKESGENSVVVRRR